MPTGRATTFAVENHEGMLYNTAPTDTKFLSMLGGLFGGEPIAGSVVIPWSEHTLRDAAVRARTEGADAQTASHVTRSPVHNVLQITQETVDTSYTKRATSNMLKAIGSNHPNVASTGLGNPVRDEHDWQIEQIMKEIGRDVEYALLNGAFVEPSTNGSARQTRGIIEATSTNHTDLATGATNFTGEDADDLIDSVAHGLANGTKIQFTALTGGSNLVLNETYYVVNQAANTFQVAVEAGGTPVSFGSNITATSTYEVVADLDDLDILALLQTVWENNGIQEQETSVIMAGAWGKRALTDQFITQKGYDEESRTLGGVHVERIETDFGNLAVVLNRFMPKNTIQVVSLEQCKVCFLVLEDGRKIKVEDLAKDGARDRTQIYFEFGLRFGNELTHGKLTGLSTR